MNETHEAIIEHLQNENYKLLSKVKYYENLMKDYKEALRCSLYNLNNLIIGGPYCNLIPLEPDIKHNISE